MVVLIRARLDRNSFIVALEDNGPGLPVDFDVRQSKQLGFRIIRRLLDQIGGTIEIESRSGRTEISLRLPMSGRTAPMVVTD